MAAILALNLELLACPAKGSSIGRIWGPMETVGCCLMCSWLTINGWNPDASIAFVAWLGLRCYTNVKFAQYVAQDILYCVTPKSRTQLYTDVSDSVSSWIHAFASISEDWRIGFCKHHGARFSYMMANSQGCRHCLRATQAYVIQDTLLAQSQWHPRQSLKVRSPEKPGCVTSQEAELIMLSE